MPSATTSCDSCGAALRPGADACDLCGTPVGSAGDERDEVTSDASGALCPSCGHANPPNARFCNRCGTALGAAAPRSAASRPAALPADSPVAPAPASTDPSAAGRRGLVVIGIGVLVVIALYGLTLWSPQPEPPPEPTDAAAVGEAAPIPPGAPPLPDSLQTAADAFAAEGTADGFYESGRYYLTAAFQAVQTDPTSSVRWARRAIEDFERSLALADDPRVRVALAEAATFDPSDPMRPIEELRTVLGQDPGNLDATFLLAERRLMIGRVDSARAAFERVVATAEPGTPVRERAVDALARLDGAE